MLLSGFFRWLYLFTQKKKKKSGNLNELRTLFIPSCTFVFKNSSIITSRLRLRVLAQSCSAAIFGWMIYWKVSRYVHEWGQIARERTWIGVVGLAYHLSSILWVTACPKGWPSAARDGASHNCVTNSLNIHKYIKVLIKSS